MLIANRNGMMVGGGGSILPPGARWVEYLESTGTQWIDTGFKANTTTTRLEASIEFTDLTSAQGVFGSRNTDTGSPASCNAFVLASNIFRPDWASSSGGSANNISISPNTIYDISITRGRLTLNSTVHTYDMKSSIDQQYNFLLFNFSNAGTAFSSGLKGRLRYAEIYSNSSLVRSFAPIAIGNTGYMLDLVTGDYLQYGNKGTGDFVIGPDI